MINTKSLFLSGVLTAGLLLTVAQAEARGMAGGAAAVNRGSHVAPNAVSHGGQFGTLDRGGDHDGDHGGGHGGGRGGGHDGDRDQGAKAQPADRGGDHDGDHGGGHGGGHDGDR
jgi:hypothetical protein